MRATPTSCRRRRSSSRGGRTVRLADLGEVKDAYSEQRTIAKMNGRQVISFNVQRSKGASEVTAYDEAWAELRKIEKEDPRIRFVEIVNQVDYTKDAISFGDGRPVAKARSSPSSSSSCSCATSARP